MRKLRADWIFAAPELLPDAVLVLDDTGTVVTVRPALPEDIDCEVYPGLICPAFVNAHCHLELSHLRGAIPPRTGMAGFVQQLQAVRSNFSDEERERAINEAAQAMWQRGVSAVGDICNANHTRAVKSTLPQMHWHNFIELFGSHPGRAEEIFMAGFALAEEMGPSSTITLHAPYSVSEALRDRVHEYASIRGWRQSIHLLESTEERELFESLEGPLMDMLRRFGLVFQGHTHESPIDYILEGCDPVMPLLLVHNTEMDAEEMEAIVAAFPWVFFVLCPRANAYIHGTTPPAGQFAAHPDRVCLGTDSLAGNTTLDIYAEMQALQEHSGLAPATILRWGTLNGANALGIPETRFRIAPGNRPDLLHLPEVKGTDPKLPHAALIIRLEP
ncbi:MAG: amidohydrolase family protein [Bacteroidota bacterium]